MLETLVRIDQQLLLWLNGHHTPLWDHIMYFVSGRYEWIPLYLILLAYIIRKYRWQSLWMLLVITVLITLSDQLANMFKEGVQRYRPCKDPDIGHLVHLVNNYCRSSYGFVSGHAANCFALATFISLFLRRKWMTIGIFLWAIIVSYSRIYLGVHYPGDVICGAMLGAMLAVPVFYLCNKYLVKGRA